MAEKNTNIASDAYLPEVFTLADGEVTGIETSSSDPKVAMDSTGFYATDAAGNKVTNITPTGAEIGGHISAKGVDLKAVDANVPVPPIENRVSWVRTADGTRAADLSTFVYDVGSPIGHVSRHQARVTNVAGTREAGIRSDVFERDGTVTVPDQVSAYAGAAGIGLIDSNGNSGIVRYKGVGQHFQAYGSGTINWPNSNAATPLTIVHGLVDENGNPLTPTSYQITQFGGLFGTQTWSADNGSNVSFLVRAVSSIVLNANMAFGWWCGC